jgi:hypothetical protein
MNIAAEPGEPGDAPHPAAFFFDSDAPGLSSWYGPPIKRAFLSAMLEADGDRLCAFQTYWGDLLTLFAYRPVSGGSYPLGTASPEATGLPAHLARHVVAQAFVVDGFSARFELMCYLCDKASESWMTLDHVSAPWLLYSKRAYIALVSSLLPGAREELDRSLSASLGAAYLGGIEVECQNAVHIQLFGRSLIPIWFYRQGWVGMEEDEGEYPPEELFEGISAEGYGWAGTRPQLVPPPHLEWGPVSPDSEANTVLAHACRRTHNEHITGQVYNLYQQAITRPITFDVGHELPRPNSEILKNKLRTYLLDPERPEGKAQYFREALGIEREDWRFLAAQLVSGLTFAQPRKLRDLHEEWSKRRQHLRYEVVMDIRGRNGNVKPIKTVWKIDGDDSPELVTAHPNSSP